MMRTKLQLLDLSGKSPSRPTLPCITSVTSCSGSSSSSCMLVSSPQPHQPQPQLPEEEVEFLHESATQGPGRSCEDPIVLSDSPDPDLEIADTIPPLESFQTPSYDRLVHLDVTSQQGGMYGGAGASVSYHIPHLPHLSYQIRLSIPSPNMNVLRPNPVYPQNPHSLLQSYIDMTLLNPNPPAFPAVEYPVTAAEALALNDFRIQQHLIDGGTFQVTRPLQRSEEAGPLTIPNGASQRVIEQHSTRTRFIKRMPTKDKSKHARRQTPKCPICLEDFADHCKIRRLRCIHNFHVKCIDQWLKKNMVCPVCRKSIVTR